MEAAIAVAEELHEVGERVVWKPQINNPGHYKPDDMLPGEVICRYENGGGFAYRIRLDMIWTDRVPAKGKQIVVGAVRAGRMFPEPKE